MANYATLKAAIQEVIKTNGNKEITGQLLQNSLIAMVNSLGANYQFAGVAATNTSPGTPDQNVFYLAFDAGTYSNFGGTVLAVGQVGIFTYNGTWTYTVKSVIELVNDLTTGGATKALSAQQGVAIKTLIDAGYLLAGVATPTTNPGTPAGKVFYIASTPGTYTHFGSPALVVADGEVAIFKYNGTWSKNVTGAATVAQVNQLGQETYKAIGGNYPLTMALEQGGISSTTGAETDNATRIRTADFIKANSIAITTSGNKVYVMGYRDDGTFVSAQGWITTNTTVTISGAKKYRLVFAKSDDSNITPTDFASLGVSVTGEYDGTLAEKSAVEAEFDEVKCLFPVLNNKYINTSGAAQTAYGWQTTGWIDITKIYGVAVYGLNLTRYASKYSTTIYPVLFKDANENITYLETEANVYAPSVIPPGATHVAINTANSGGAMGVNRLIWIINKNSQELKNISQFKYIGSISNAQETVSAFGLYSLGYNPTNVPASYNPNRYGFLLIPGNTFRLLWNQGQKRFWACINGTTEWYEMSGDAFDFTTLTTNGIATLLNTAIDNGALSLSGTELTPTEEYPKSLIPYATGVMVSYDDVLWNVKKYTVVPGTTYRVVASKQYNNCLYVFYDAANNVVEKAGSGTSAVQSFDGLVCAPATASYILVAYKSDLNTGSLQTPELRPGLGEKIWTGKKWVAIGDSLTEVNYRATKNYLGYVSEKTGITTVNMGLSGSGYRKKYDTNQAFYQRVANIPTDADVVTIFGSGNDLSLPDYDLGEPTDTGTSTLCGCINTTLDNILTLFMNANKVPVIGVITPTPWISYGPSNPSNRMALYSAAIIECCRRKSIPVLDLYHESNLHPDDATFRTLAYSRDEGNGVHPDERGHEIIAPMFENFLKSLLLS